MLHAISEFSCSVISGPVFHVWGELKEANQSDPYLVDLHQKIQLHPADIQDYRVREGLVLFKDRVVVPPPPHQTKTAYSKNPMIRRWQVTLVPSELFNASLKIFIGQV